MKKQTGFTLVEIAIVMVIIGLLLGGVLKGQEIITNAKIKNLENDFNGITAAIYSYQDRYRALPGDDLRATSRFKGTVPVGDGNGNIAGRFDSAQDSDESRRFWAHLRFAGLVAGEPVTPYDQPLNAFNGRTGVSSDKPSGGGGGGGGGSTPPPNMSGVYVGFSNIPLDVAVILESRSDDYNSQDGNIQADQGKAGKYTDLTDGEINLYFAL